ncbi:MAG: hypothetical protein HDQ87_08930 [Clostridia bacterium]|nr:hypothetical protein [Clostridia bacterium]
MLLRRFAGFVADWRLLILVILIAVCGLLALQIPNVAVVGDQSAYLSENSEIRTGLEILEEEFPDIVHENTIRVMFRGLSGTAREDVERQLLRTPYVATVTYGDGSDYYRDPYSLYVLTTEYPYGSAQQRDLMEGLERNFEGYDMTVANDSAGTSALPWWTLLAVYAVAAAVLFALCPSWPEPLLILACCAMAAAANAGSNIMMPRISELSQSLSPILVTAMTAVSAALYAASWRREYAAVRDPQEATVRSLMASFPLLLGTLLASAGAFLMLTLLRSGLAADLGLVTAKGMLWSFIAVLFGMPAMMSLAAAPVLHSLRPGLQMDGRMRARRQFDSRRGLSWTFAVIAALSAVFSFFTVPAFGIPRHDAITREFPEENDIIVVYQNGDENPAGTLAHRFERMPDITSVSSYATTLGEQYTAQEMYTMLHTSGSAMPLSLPLLEILYYDRYTDAQLPFITAGDLIRFINTDVDSAEGLNDLLSPETIQLFQRMAPFTDPVQLGSPVNISQAGTMFGISQEETIELFSQYYTVRGNGDAENMSADTFLEYILSVIAEDPQYAEEMTASERERLERLAVYADPASAQEALSASAAASRLGIDEESMRIIYAEYYAANSAYSPPDMSLPEFIHFMQDSVLTSDYFSRQMPEGISRELDRAESFTDAAANNQQMSPAELSTYLGIGENAVRNIIATYHQTDTGQMSLPQFLIYVTSPAVAGTDFYSSLSEQQRTELPRLNAAVQAAIAGQPLSADRISPITGLPIQIVDSVFDALSPEGETPVSSMMLSSFLTAVTSGAYQNEISEEDMEQLERMQSAVEAAPQALQYSASQIAPLTGLDGSQASRVYTMYSREQASGETMSPYELVQYVDAEPGLQEEIGSSAADTLTEARRLMEAGQSTLSPETAASLFGFSSREARLLFAYHESMQASGASWAVPLGTLLTFLTAEDSPAEDLVPQADREALRQWARLAAAAADGREYTPAEMAELLGLDADFTRQVFRRYLVDSGEIETWAVPLQDLINFIATTGDGGYQGPGLEWIRQMAPLIDAVAADKQYSALGFYMLLDSLGQHIDESTVELIYLYYAAMQVRNTVWTMSPLGLIDYLADEVLEEPAYSAYLDENMSSRIRELQDEIEAAGRRLKGANYSIMTISTDLPLESPQMRTLYDTITSDLQTTMVGTYYLVGDIPVSYEMSRDFTPQLSLLSLLSGVCAYIGACIVMRSLFVPLLMVILAQSSVWLAAGILGIGSSVYYLALLCGECFAVPQVTLLAMSFGEDYRRRRHRLDIEESMRALYDNGTMLAAAAGGAASACIFLFLWITGQTTAPGEIAAVLMLAAAVGTVLVLTLLPALLGAADRYVKAKTLSAIPLEQKERPGGSWNGKRLLDEQTLVGLHRDTFRATIQEDEERRAREAAAETSETESSGEASQSGGDEERE